MEFMKSDFNPALKYVKVDHRLVNVVKLTFVRLYLRSVIRNSYWKFCYVKVVKILCKSKITAAKPDAHLSHNTNELATKFQRLYPCFRRCPTQLYYMKCHRKLISAENPRWRPENRNFTIFDTLSTSCNLPIIARFRGIADSLVLMSLLLVLECIAKSNIGAAKPEIHIKIYIHKYA